MCLFSELFTRLKMAWRAFTSLLSVVIWLPVNIYWTQVDLLVMLSTCRMKEDGLHLFGPLRINLPMLSSKCSFLTLESILCELLKRIRRELCYTVQLISHLSTWVTDETKVCGGNYEENLAFKIEELSKVLPCWYPITVTVVATSVINTTTVTIPTDTVTTNSCYNAYYYFYYYYFILYYSIIIQYHY